MNTQLFVGNISFQATENDVQELFSQFGPVSQVNLITDKETGRPRGFGFVTMATPEAAQAAMQGLEGKDWNGRALSVKEARAREERSERSFAGARGGGRDRGRDRGGRGGDRR